MTKFYSDTPSAQVSQSYYQTLEDFLYQNAPNLKAADQHEQNKAITHAPATVDDYLSLVERTNKELGGDWGIDLGLQFRPATYGILGLLPLHCENLLEALDMVIKFESLVHDLGTSSIHSEQDTVIFKWHSHFHNLNYLKPISESIVAGMQQFSSWLSGRHIPIKHLVLPAPCHHPWLLDQGMQTSQKTGPLEMHINLSDLLVPISQADREIKEALLNSAELMLKKKQPDWIKKLINWFDEQLPQNDCTLEQAADLLCLSSRSLQRRLQVKGMTFQQLLSNFRKDKARYLLTESSMSILDISIALGFKEQSSFSKAFKTWFGCSPAEFTKQHQP